MITKTTDNNFQKISRSKNYQKIIKSKIEEELKKLEYNFSYKGTRYLVDAIYTVYNLQKDYECNLQDEVYKIVAKKYNTSSNNVKCNITNATDIMFYDCDENVLKEFLHNVEFSKPGPKTIIFEIANRI